MKQKKDMALNGILGEIKNLGDDIADNEQRSDVRNDERTEEDCQEGVEFENVENLGEMSQKEIIETFKVMETRVKRLEDLLSGSFGRVGGESRSIHKHEMALWVLEAIEKGNGKFGVSRCFIRKYLCECFGMPENTYYYRKLSTVLGKGIAENKLLFDKVHQLYKLA